MGLLISMCVRYWIAGTLPPIHGQPKGKSQSEVWLLFGISLLSGLLVVATTVAKETYISKKTSYTIRRLAGITQQTVSMTMGWCLLFWGQWEFWSSTHGRGLGPGDQMTARIIMALTFSFMGFTSIYAIDFVADRSG